MKNKFLISLALCLSLLGAANPLLAQDGQGSEEDALAQLQREGWRIVRDGVLQRELVPGEIESFVFGVPGFIWKIQDLKKQLKKLQAELRAHPTSELRKAIVNHRKAIAHSRRALALARAAEANGEEIDFSKVSCTINFSYNATAGPRTDVQGTFASSGATFGANCGGFSGQVYAYAFAQVTVNGASTTETVTDGPRSGANVSASAYASRSGVSPCESNSYGEMVSYSLSPSSYSMSASNSQCPTSTVPTPTISGVSYIDLWGGCRTYTWTASVSGGIAPLTYQWTWNGTAVGTGSSYSRQFCTGATYSRTFNTLGLTVTDSASSTGSTSKSVEVENFGG